MEETKSISITSLITIPALITLGITILRLVGELEHWPKPWFSAAAGGGGAPSWASPGCRSSSVRISL